MIGKTILTTSVLILTGIGVCQASLMAQWTFESSRPTNSGPYVAESGINAGSSMASGSHAGSSTYSNPAGAGSAESFSSSAWAVGDYYQFTTSTLGYNGVTVSFEAASSGTGPKDFQLAYSTDGSTFTVFTTYSVLVNTSTDWKTSMTPENKQNYAFGFDLSAITALDNQSSIYLRLVDNSTTSANGNTVSGGGTSRVDDFTICASALPTSSVPEPSTFIAGALLGLPFVMQGFKRLRHHPGKQG